MYNKLYLGFKYITIVYEKFNKQEFRVLGFKKTFT